MCDADSAPVLQHILVALDGSPHSRAALDAAVRLAAPGEATVEGLFIEDERLLRTAQLPFVDEIRSYTDPPQHLDEDRMQRRLRHRAQRAEQALIQKTEQAEVSYEFRTVQGKVTSAIRAAAAKTDLLVLGKTSTDSSRRRLGTTSRALLTDAPAPVLVLRKTVPAEHPILLYYDGSEAAQTALQLAVALTRFREHVPMKVLLPAHDDADPGRLREQVESHPTADVPLRIYPLSRSEIQHLSAFARQKEGLVILPACCPSLSTTSLQQFLYDIDRPLLVVP